MNNANDNNRVKGFSLRDSLTHQGVTNEQSLREHLSFVAATLACNPLLDIRRYRANPENPNSAPVMG